MKTFTKCGLAKDESEFYKRDNRPSGTVSSCKKCCIARFNAWAKTPAGKASAKKYYASEKGRKVIDAYKNSEEGRAAREAYENTPEYKRSKRSSQLKNKYGITIDDYERMLEEQDGCCKICRSTQPGRDHPSFSVDHDHVTLRVRGLLCHDCNVLLARAKDCPLILEAAIGYLVASKERT